MTDKRISLNVLTKFERVHIIGYRASQLQYGIVPILIPFDPDKEVYDPIEIATKELEAKVLPFIIERLLPHGKKEYWHLKELIQIH